MTYPLSFRRKILSVREQEGLTVAQVAARFGVGIANVARWIKNPVPQAIRNKPATKIDMAALARDVREYPDAYQAERARRLSVSKKGIGHALRRMHISYKKTLQHPRADEDERHLFQETMQTYQAQYRIIIYIDESGFAHDRLQTHGYAPIGGAMSWCMTGTPEAVSMSSAHESINVC